MTYRKTPLTSSDRYEEHYERSLKSRIREMAESAVRSYHPDLSTPEARKDLDELIEKLTISMHPRTEEEEYCQLDPLHDYLAPYFSGASRSVA